MEEIEEDIEEDLNDDFFNEKSEVIVVLYRWACTCAFMTLHAHKWIHIQIFIAVPFVLIVNLIFHDGRVFLWIFFHIKPQ